MAVTQNTYTGNGSTVLFSFTFPYLETTDIKVSVNGTNTTAYTLANATTIQFNTAPANGAAIRIYRQTDDSALAATFYPGSAIRSADLNENFTQNLYVTQESTNNAASATTTANTALTNSNTAISTANSAVSTANTASANASAAVSTANTASSNASAAVSTANTASSNATAAVNTANAATATANSATSTAASALSTANAATSTANAASAAATNAVNTANAASSTASSAVSTANTASSNASAAVSTANTASSNATSAVNTANSALSTANAAASAVANAILYDIVANVAAIPGSPANNDAVEVTNSTGIESFTPLTGVPVGFVGNSGLSVRLVYTTTGNTWTWIQYFPNDPESRYLKLSGGTLTGQLKADDSTSVVSPVIAFDGDTNTGIAHTGADELALVTGGTARLTIDASGNVAVPGGLTKGGNSVVTTGDTGSVTSTMIADGTIIDADINATAGIAGTKVIPSFGAQNINTTGTATAASFIPASSTAPTNGVYLPSANTVGISTNGTGRLSIDANGNVAVDTYTLYVDAVNNRVGIGTTSPDATLTVVGDGAAIVKSGDASRPRIFFEPIAGNAQKIVPYQNGVAAGCQLAFCSGAAGSERGRFDDSGRFLVGTSSTRSFQGFDAGGARLQLEGTAYQSSSASFINNQANTDGAYLLLGKSRGTSLGSTTIVSSGDSLGAIWFTGADGSVLQRGAIIEAFVDGTPGANDMPGRLVFSVTRDGSASPTEALRITNGGETRIFCQTAANGLIINHSDTARNVYAFYEGRYSTTDNTGGTGTRSYIVYTSGDVRNVNNSYGAISDIKLKENIVDANSQWDDIKALQVRNYNFKEGQTHTQIGLVAQEVELVSPGLVTESPDRDAEGNDLGTKTKSVNYSVLYMKAVKALQEAMERIETLEAKVAALESA